MRLSPQLILTVTLFGSFAILGACGASGDDESGGGAGGFGGTGGGGGGDGDASIDVATGGQPEGGGGNFSEYCGLGPCIPGIDVTFCSGMGGEGGLGGEGGIGGEGGVGGTGTGPTGTGGGPIELSCQVVALDDEPASACAPSGSGRFEEPCQSGADCDQGLGCVLGEGSTIGQCLPFCCGDVETCPDATHCALRTLASDDLLVPVCEPIEPCELLNEEGCADGETCAVVRSDGTTSCVPVRSDDDGKLCDPCPCAPGFVCSQVTGTCQQLCHTDDQYAEECMGGSCLGGSNGYPQGFGVCVGGPAACP